MKSIIKRIIRWVCSPAGIASAILLVFSIILFVAGFSNWRSLFNLPAENINSILFGLATNLLGIIVTISFVQHFLNIQRKKDEKSEETKRILRNDRILDTLIREYTLYYNRVTTPIEEASRISDSKINLEFAFSDLRDLYKPTLLLRNSFQKTAIAAFLASESSLVKYCCSFIQDVDFTYYPELCDVLLKLVEVSNTMNTREFLVGNQEIFMNQDASLIQRMIEDNSTNWVEEVHSGNIKGNIIIPYVILYDLLKQEGALVKQYCSIVETIKEQA